MENRVSSVTDYEYHGAEGFQEWIRDVFEHFGEGARYEVEEVLAAGEDFVVARYCISGPGAFSEELIQFRWVGVTWLREGKATRAVGYPSRHEALHGRRPARLAAPPRARPIQAAARACRSGR